MPTSDTVKSWIGIDNGLSGAIAILRSDGSKEHMVTPTLTNGKENKIDICAVRDFILKEENVEIVIVENGPKQPAFGCVGNFRNGHTHGAIEAMLDLHKFPYKFITPQSWQGVIFKGARGVVAGQTKEASVSYVRGRFPDVNLLPTPRSKNPHDGIADAFCIAEYAKMTHH